MEKKRRGGKVTGIAPVPEYNRPFCHGHHIAEVRVRHTVALFLPGIKLPHGACAGAADAPPLRCRRSATRCGPSRREACDKKMIIAQSAWAGATNRSQNDTT